MSEDSLIDDEHGRPSSTTDTNSRMNRHIKLSTNGNLIKK
jgi:hypothetical protein